MLVVVGHCWLLLDIVAYCLTLLRIVGHCCLLLHIVAYCWTVLLIVGHCWLLLDSVGCCWSVLVIVACGWTVLVVARHYVYDVLVNHYHTSFLIMSFIFSPIILAINHRSESNMTTI